jgi:hypothetical protein
MASGNSRIGASQPVEVNRSNLSSDELSSVVKQHTHDLRNALNGVSVDLALIGETTDETDRLAAVGRLRNGIKCIELLIRTFNAKFVAEGPSYVTVADATERWKADAKCLLPWRSLTWEAGKKEGVIRVQPELFRSVLNELLLLSSKCTQQDSIGATCRLSDTSASFETAIVRVNANQSTRMESLGVLWSMLARMAASCGAELAAPADGPDGRTHHRIVIPLVRDLNRANFA